jgi:2-methylcitrate dehydratase PrpD
VLREGTVGVRHLESHYLFDLDLKKLAQLVEVVVDDEINSFFPRKRGARVEIFLKDGRRLEKTTYTLKGSPDLPVGWDVIQRKFFDCTSGVLSEQKIFQLVMKIKKLEDLTDICQIVELMSVE